MIIWNLSGQEIEILRFRRVTTIHFTNPSIGTYPLYFCDSTTTTTHEGHGICLVSVFNVVSNRLIILPCPYEQCDTVWKTQTNARVPVNTQKR